MSERGCGHCTTEGWCIHDDAKCCFEGGVEHCCPDYLEPTGLIVHYIDTALIDHHPDNPRKAVEDVTELAESIRAEGIQQPLTVISHVGGELGRYTAVIGHRRLEAAKKAGLQKVPAFVREMNRREQLRTMMTENTQREDLTPLEEADGFRQIMLELPEQTVAAVARETGFSETTVRRRMKLLELPREAVEEAESRGVSLRDYEQLNKLKDPERRAKVAEHLGAKTFDRELAYHMAREKEQNELDRLEKSLVAKGARPMTEVERRGRDDLSVEKTFYNWNMDGASVGGLAKDQQWLYTIDRDMVEIRVYRVVKQSEQETAEKSPVELARQKLQARTELLKEELAALHREQIALDQEFLDRREAFVEEFSTFQRHREEIMEMAVMTLIRRNWWSDAGLEELGGWLGITDVKDDAALARCIRANPEKALLYTLYVILERDAAGWHTDEYFQGQKYHKYYCQPRQELLYDCLRLIGYQAQGDEQLARLGAHDLYHQAPKLIEQYKKDKRELDRQINA